MSTSDVTDIKNTCIVGMYTKDFYLENVIRCYWGKYFVHVDKNDKKNNNIKNIYIR